MRKKDASYFQKGNKWEEGSGWCKKGWREGEIWKLFRERGVRKAKKERN